MLKAIPPRAPSRSSKSHILSYTAHLAILARFDEYNSSDGGAALLHRAEHGDPLDKLDDDAREADQKAAGLFKVSYNLSRKADGLPRTVERRVTLARLVDDVLSPAEPSRAIHKIADVEDTIPSVADKEVNLLSALNSQDNTIVHSAVPSSIGANSIAQSLIDLKFGSKRDNEGRPTSSGGQADEKKGQSVFENDRMTTTPHLDYRIVRGQEMRSRAKAIYAESILPSADECWCRRHRVANCTVCTTMVKNVEKADLVSERAARLKVIGQGLQRVDAGRKRLIEVIPTFLEFSAALLRDVRDRAAMLDLDANEVLSELIPDEGRIDPTAAWYNLLHSLCTQAVLEGYLVDGWTGTNAIEVLLNIGCGVWDGKGWLKRPPPSTTSHSPSRHEEDEEADESDDEAQEEQLKREEAHELARQRLVEAAECLLCSRDSAQADFERSMRDRTQEFLNIPEDLSLHEHLVALNKKYPLSTFEADIAEFLEAANRLLGMPTLAKVRFVSSSPSGATVLTCGR